MCTNGSKLEIMYNQEAKCVGFILVAAQESESAAKKYLGLTMSGFVPTHRNNGITLKHKFACFCNYKFQEL